MSNDFKTELARRVLQEAKRDSDRDDSADDQRHREAAGSLAELILSLAATDHRFNALERLEPDFTPGKQVRKVLSLLGFDKTTHPPRTLCTSCSRLRSRITYRGRRQIGKRPWRWSSVSRGPGHETRGAEPRYELCSRVVPRGPSLACEPDWTFAVTG
jgi:hypothetical protein